MGRGLRGYRRVYGGFRHVVQLDCSRLGMPARVGRTMMDNGAIGSMMSGSGPTVFGIFDSPAAAKQAVKAVRATKLAKQICLTTPYNVKR